MVPWTKVVTHPLGLIGFALFLVFSFLAKTRQKGRPKWLSGLAFALAFVTLLGGFGLAYMQSKGPAPTPGNEQRIGTIQQKSSGDSTANVAGVQGGDVSVTIAQPAKAKEIEPLTLEDVSILLRAKTVSDKIVAEINKRGVAFVMTPDHAATLRSAGATQTILDAIDKN